MIYFHLFFISLIFNEETVPSPFLSAKSVPVPAPPRSFDDAGLTNELVKNIVCTENYKTAEKTTVYLTQITLVQASWGLLLNTKPVHVSTNLHSLAPEIQSNIDFKTGAVLNTHQVDELYYLESVQKLFCDDHKNTVVYETPNVPFLLKVGLKSDDIVPPSPLLPKETEIFATSSGNVYKCWDGECRLLDGAEARLLEAVRLPGDDVCASIDLNVEIKVLQVDPKRSFTCHVLDSQEEYDWFYDKETQLISFLQDNYNRFGVETSLEEVPEVTIQG